MRHIYELCVKFLSVNRKYLMIGTTVVVLSFATLLNSSNVGELIKVVGGPEKGECINCPGIPGPNDGGSGGAWDGDPPKDWPYHSLPETVVRLDSESVRICQPNGSCRMVPTLTTHKKNLNEIVPELSKGQMVYNRLQTMWRGEPETVVLKIDLATPPALAEAFPGERRHVETPVTPFMTADLNGTAGLVVEPSDPVRKRVSEIGTTPWQWTVTATDFADTEVLTLEVGIHLDDGDPYPLKTFEDEIEVKVTNLQLVGDVVDEFNPIWAFVVGAIPVAWGAFAWVRGRKWKQPETSSEWKPFSRRDRPDSATKKPIKKQNSD